MQDFVCFWLCDQAAVLCSLLSRHLINILFDLAHCRERCCSVDRLRTLVPSMVHKPRCFIWAESISLRGKEQAISTCITKNCWGLPRIISSRKWYRPPAVPSAWYSRRYLYSQSQDTFLDFLFPTLTEHGDWETRKQRHQ